MKFLFDRLLPQGDEKQRIRAKRALQAMGSGVIQSLVSVILFLAGGFKLALSEFFLLMGLLWVGHLTLFTAIRSGINERLTDPSMTREMVIWSTVTLLATIFFMDRYRPLMMMFFPIILIYGAFRMTPRQYLATAALMILGYILVVVSTYGRYPDTPDGDSQVVVAVVFVLVILAVSFVSNEISLFRKRLHRRNAELASAMEKIEYMTITDELTGLTNRRHMMVMLQRQKALAQRGGNGFCVCFFDLDRFKTVNDTLGHHTGDIVLRQFAAAARAEIRVADLLARFGGEEFVLMAVQTDLAGAKIVAERIRKAVQTIRFADIAPDLSVTVSGGVAQFRHKDNIETLLARADKALYLAKNSGRNCVKTETDDLGDDSP